MEAYAQLAAEGYLVSRQGAAHARRRARRRAAGRGRRRAEPAPPRFDFRPGAPDVVALPARGVGSRRCARGCATRPTPGFELQRPARRPELRDALATLPRPGARRRRRPRDGRGHLGPDPGARPHCPGAGRARRAADRASRSPAQRRPASADRRRRAGVGRGRRRRRRARVAALERSDVGRGARHARPPVPHRRRARPASGAPRCSTWAVARDAFVLEDDYDAEYRYDRPARRRAAGPRPAARRLHELDQQDAGPGAADRLARRAAARSREAIAHEKATDDRGTPVLDPARARRSCSSAASSTATCAARGSSTARRRDALIAALARHLPELRPRGAAAGLHLAPRPARRRRRGCAGARGRRAAASGSTASPRIAPVPGARA